MKRTRTSVSGFVGRIRIFLPIILLWLGGQSVYTALTNRQPHSVTFAEYVRTHPDYKWVELKDTKLDILNCIGVDQFGTVSEVYVPLHAPDEPDDARIAALLLTRDPATIDLVKQFRALQDEKAMLEFAVKNRERLFPRRTVRGLVQFGIDSDDRERRKIAKLDAKLAGDFAVIEDGKKPDISNAVVLLVGGLAAVWFCWFWRSKPAEGIPATPAGSPPPLPGSPPPLPK